MAQFDKTSVEYETILDCAEIEEELTRYNRNWFRQAKDTPFGQGELYDLVGYDGLTPQATAIVDGDNLNTFGIQIKRELRFSWRNASALTRLIQFPRSSPRRTLSPT